MRSLSLAACFILLVSLITGCGALKTVSKGAVGAASISAKVLTYPISALRNKKDTYVGLASWYGDKYHGRRTSNGEIYNQYKLTAAHRTLAFNTLVKVTNLKNGKSVIVRINDRGPFVRGRIIDLSYAAAKEIGMLDDGVQKVELKILR
jgi:rare lipoprotein A